MKRQSDTAPQAETVMPNVNEIPQGPDGLGPMYSFGEHFCDVWKSNNWRGGNSK